MNKLILLTDYKGYFGSKWDANPYRSGFDLELLSSCFLEYGFTTEFISFSEIYKITNIKNRIILYTSSEDSGYYYKQYIEDIILFLEKSSAILLPSYEFLRANNNKVYMELFRRKNGNLWGDVLNSWTFGTLEEMEGCFHEFNYPIVIKTASGAMSRGVSLANDEKDLQRKVKKISRSRNIRLDIKDYLRPIKHLKYKKDSVYRNKFILQKFIPNLKNDWKILIFGEKYYVLTRHTKNNDFRASGSHYKYLAGSKSIMPVGLLNYAKLVFQAINIPHLSIDVVHDGNCFHLIEFQALYFGTSTINMSDIYYINDENGNWVQIPNNESLELVYTESIVQYLRKKNG